MLENICYLQVQQRVACEANEQNSEMLMKRNAQIRFTSGLGSLDCAGCESNKGLVVEQVRNIGTRGLPGLRLNCVADNRL